MNKRTVRALKELHGQLRSTESLTEGDREVVRLLQQDIEKLLASPETGEQHQVVLEGLQDATQRFEVSHPELTAVMSRVIDALSTMGI
jgi:hypothetical protein